MQWLKKLEELTTRIEKLDKLFEPHPHQLGGLGERCKLPYWDPGRSPGLQRVFPHFKHSG